jgi:hypothetical protein
LVGVYIAATIIVLAQYLRLRERRLLPLAALFAFQVQALGREWWDVWKDVYQGAACGAGLLLLVLTLRHPAAVKPSTARVPPSSPSEEIPPRAPEPRPPAS